MDELELALMAGFDRAAGRLTGAGRDPEEVARLVRRVSSKVVSGPLRSWALALRACDGRIPDKCAQGTVGLTGERVRAWCGPVVIGPPGVSLSAAARLFGVNRTTASRWADPDPPPEDCARAGVCFAGDAERPAGLSSVTEPARDASRHPLNNGTQRHQKKRVTWKQDVERQIEQARAAAAGDRFGVPSSYRVVGWRLVLDYTLNRANRKRDGVRVWTPYAYGVDPGGEVWSADWGLARRRLVELVPEGFGQVLTRVDRRLSGRARVWQWVCPAGDGGCGRLVFKLYWPMEVWTVAAALGSEAEAARCRGEWGAGGGPFSAGGVGQGFLCGRCCGLVYESSERESSPGVRGDGSRRRVDVWDRFVKRVSGGVLRGGEVAGAGQARGGRG